MNGEFTIRAAASDDREALFEVCNLCAFPHGETKFSDYRLPGLLWAIPYLELEPDFAFVLTRDERVVGYVVGTPDSQTFFEKQCKEWFPVARSMVEEMAFVASVDRQVIHTILSPTPPDKDLLRKFPAHLHINILSEARGGGLGGLLLGSQIEALRQYGAKGVHVGLNREFPNSSKFYERHGFDWIQNGRPWLMAQEL